jgi:hypothetical protein
MRYAAHYRPTRLPGATPAGRTSITRHPDGLLSARSTPRYGIAGVGVGRAGRSTDVGTDLVHASPTTHALPTNAAVIAVDQDPLGYAAREVSTANGLDLLARPLSGGVL